MIEINNKIKSAAISMVAIFVLVSCSPKSQLLTKPANDISIWPKLNIEVEKDKKIEEQITQLMSSMTLEQKVAQMIQPEIRDFTVEDMRRYGFGSYLNGGGAFPNNNKHATANDWVDLAEQMYQASIDDSLDGSTIPTMWGTDAVHGHNNVIGATLFPHNIGLGAANNPALIEQIARVTAKEVLVTGIDWIFAPTVAVVRDDRWGRTYEGYSEDPEIVKSYAASIVRGLQGRYGENFLDDDKVISTVKHFVGDGGTKQGMDQGDNISSEKELFEIHAQGYVGGLSAGAQSVMASFNSWHGKKNHGNYYLLTSVLKEKMGFDGFVVGDWLGHGQIKGCSNESCPQAINAGLDIYMASTTAWKPLMQNTIAQVKSGLISQSRIDDAVRRILRVKLRAGLFDKPSPIKRKLAGQTQLLAAVEHRKIARQAVRESLVLLKNKHNILPLNPKQSVLVAGAASNNIGMQSGGWTITWQGSGNKNEDFPNGISIYDGIKQVVESAGGLVSLSEQGDYKHKPDVAIVVFGEKPYAEGAGDIKDLNYRVRYKKDLALLKKLKQQGIPTVSIFISGRPMWVNSELNASDAFVAAWLPGTEGGGIAEVLFSKENGEIKYDFKGRLSYSWPADANQTAINRFDKNKLPLLPYGFGLSYGDKNILSDNLSEEFILDDSQSKTELFNRVVLQPWRLMLEENGKQTEMIANSLDLTQISIRTLDKEVQEDARQVEFKGQSEVAVALISDGPSDLSNHQETKSMLSMQLRIEQAPTKPVYLSMDCDNKRCASIDISKEWLTMAKNQWQTFNVDLACLVKAGANLSEMTAPFVVHTSGKMKWSFAEIIIQPIGQQKPSLYCGDN